MKLKLTAFIFILALAVASWAQTATQNTPPPAPQENAAPQAKGDCCHKIDSAKEGQSCCRHEMAGKDEKAMSCCAGEKAAVCCGGKDATSCMKGDKDKAAASCVDSCGKNHEKGCCASHKKGDKTATNCCGGKQCGEHSASHAQAGGK
jgi:hypothetical protein